MQVVIFGDGEADPNRENALLLSLECCKLDLPLLISRKLSLLDFESRKDAAQVISCTTILHHHLSWSYR